MITMSDKAQAKAKEFVHEKNASTQYLRLFVEAGGCSGFQYGLAIDDKKNEDDTSFAFDGFEVVVDPASQPYLSSAHIDYTESLNGAGFSISNPQAKSNCGCGKSFGV